jgi:hypothetical protein
MKITTLTFEMEFQTCFFREREFPLSLKPELYFRGIDCQFQIFHRQILCFLNLNTMLSQFWEICIFSYHNLDNIFIFSFLFPVIQM